MCSNSALCHKLGVILLLIYLELFPVEGNIRKFSRSIWVKDRLAVMKRGDITNGSVPFQQVGMKFIPVIDVTKSNLLTKVKAIKVSPFFPC